MAPFRVLARLRRRGGAGADHRRASPGPARCGHATDQIAALEVDGIILDDLERDELLADIAESDNVRALVLRINSPGGTTAGSEALFAVDPRRRRRRSRWWRSWAKWRPRAATSPRIAADHIVARGNTLTGSIGVIMEYPDLTGLMARIGVGLRDGALVRAQGRAVAVPPDQPGGARAATQAMVAESYGWFRGLVAERRGLAGADARRGRERRGLHRARSRSKTAWSTRSAASPRRSPGSNCATPALRGSAGAGLGGAKRTSRSWPEFSA